MPYRVSFEGEAFNTDDLTLDEAIAIEKVTGRSWVLINPFRSAEDCKAIIAAFLARKMGEAEAAKLVGGLSLKAVLDSVELIDDMPTSYENGLPDPKVEGPGTGGSSTSDGHLDAGPQT